MINRPLTALQYCCTSLVVVCAWAGNATADLIKLQNGGELRGEIVGKDVADDEHVEIVTLSGARITVAREHAQFVTRRPLIVEVYETRARQTPDTIDAQWKLAEWCRQQGAKLRQEREIHLHRIIRLDPEHQRAHAALKHTKRNGVWMTYDEGRLAEGYVKYKGRYITQQELDLIVKTTAELEAEQAWFKQVRLWKIWLKSRNQQRQQEGYNQLSAIVDPNAVAALNQNFDDEENQQLRMFYVKILDKIPGDKPVAALVERSLFDTVNEIRYQALNALADEQYPTATTLFVRGLDNESNEVVRRAARALGRVADDQVVPDLIDALVTTHRYRIRVPSTGGTLSFGANGSFANSGQSLLTPEIESMLRAGQFPNGVIVNNPNVNQLRRTKVVKVNYSHQNAEVLAALQKLTGANHGYDERNWRLWWTAQKNGTAALGTNATTTSP